MTLEQIKKQVSQNNNTWLLTGCAGFIGSHLLENLLESQQRVIGIDNLSTGSMENIEQVKNRVSQDAFQNFEFFEGDILDQGLLQQVPSFDFVLHTAAQASVPHSIEHPLHTFQVNVVGTENIFELARLGKATKVIYASSSAVYGDDPAEKKIESQTGNPLSPYANSKSINEIQARQLSKVYQVPSVGLRYFNVFGVRQSPDGPYAAVIPGWMGQLKSHKPVQVHGPGDNTRDFIHVHDVVKVNLLAALSKQQSDEAWVVNVAGGRAISLLELFDNMSSAWKSVYPKIEVLSPLHGPERAGDIKHSLGDISKAKDLLGFEVEVEIIKGLRDMVKNL